MKETIYRKEDFIKLLDITEAELERWEKAGCIRHLGTVDNTIPLYTDTNLDEARRIQELIKIGYDIDSVQKIIRKIGLPKPTKKAKGEAKVIEFLTVGELASKAHLNSRTIKYWEERGIIQPDGRSTGGFRLYSKIYIYLCNLIKDLQNFGYSLEEIKDISDLFRDFIAMRQGTSYLSRGEIRSRLMTMQRKIESLTTRIDDLKSGIQRWDDLLKRKKKEIIQLLSKAENGGKTKIPKQKEATHRDVQKRTKRKSENA